MKRTYNIVIVDDEEGVHLLYDYWFKNEERQGIVKLYKFFNGLDCLDYIKAHRSEIQFDVVVTDIGMPEMDGFDLLINLKKLDSSLEIHVVSAYGSEEYRKKAEDLGADQIYVKPINYKELKEKLLSPIHLSQK